MMKIPRLTRVCCFNQFLFCFDTDFTDICFRYTSFDLDHVSHSTEKVLFTYFKTECKEIKLLIELLNARQRNNLSSCC